MLTPGEETPPIVLESVGRDWLRSDISRGLDDSNPDIDIMSSMPIENRRLWACTLMFFPQGFDEQAPRTRAIHQLSVLTELSAQEW